MSHLSWHGYRYYPYERDLAHREVLAMLGRHPVQVSEGGVRLSAGVNAEAASRLTYFSDYDLGEGVTATTQARLEKAARSSRMRQATRYSVHGLHEYKGRFNPQVAKAILNIFGLTKQSRVLDPFCGSGTTLVECAHLGAEGVGTDLNPLAAFLANAKLAALSTPAATLRKASATLSRRLSLLRKPYLPPDGTSRGTYLASWFDQGQLAWIEAIRIAIEETCGPERNVFLALASNLLRDYSDQEPLDLRVRRRRSPLPEVGFREAFISSCDRFLDRLEAAQLILGTPQIRSRAVVADMRMMGRDDLGGPFDAAITSPPYATALPYIDTQRLSLVWLTLCSPHEVKVLEAALVGSREMRLRDQAVTSAALHDNASALPDEQAAFCRRLADAVGMRDGFRRKAVPPLIYRYLSEMRDGFAAVHAHLRAGARYALVVGHNHTVLSGERQDINTPVHLASLAESVGWTLEEALPLQTYQRYGLHAANAVGAETLIVLRR